MVAAAFRSPGGPPPLGKMPKPKSNKAKSKPSQRAQKKTQKSINWPQAETSLYTRGVCSVANPFCPEAAGARYPDDSFTKSVGWSVPALQEAISTDVNGNYGRLYFGDALYQTNIATNIVGAAVTYNPTTTTMFNIPSGMVRWRITSWGIKVDCIAAPLSLTGMLRVRLFSPMTLSTLASTSLTSNMADACYDVPLHRLLDKSLFIRPAELGITARTFQSSADLTSVLASAKNFGWQVVQLGITGAPASTAVINCTYYYNYEFVFADGDALTAFAKHPPANNPSVKAGVAGVVERVGHFIEGTAESVDRIFKSKAASLLANVAAAYFPAGRAAQIANGMSMLAIKEVD